MQKIEKFLNKLSLEERLKVSGVINQILISKTDGLNVKKLRGDKDIFRIRVGKVRILYKRIGVSYIVLKVGWRDDTTYKDY